MKKAPTNQEFSHRQALENLRGSKKEPTPIPPNMQSRDPMMMDTLEPPFGAGADATMKLGRELRRKSESKFATYTP